MRSRFLEVDHEAMTKHSFPHAKPCDRAITWERALAIFGNPLPPKTIWERQFDRADDALRRLASTPHEKITDLWCYYHDLAHVELQPELFEYLFPACLMDWHSTLMNHLPCSAGDSEFHYGVHKGKVFEKMLSPVRREQVMEFFRDSLVERLERQHVFATVRNRFPSTSWICRLNSLGIILPNIELIWNELWLLDTPGRAIAALQYLSGLMYFDGENPLFQEWFGESPSLCRNDSFIFHDGWPDNNAGLLTATLTPAFVRNTVPKAVTLLQGHPEFKKAKKMESDLERAECQKLIEVRVAELPVLLRTPDPDEWTV